MARVGYAWIRRKLTWRNAISASFMLIGLAWRWLGIASRIKFILAIVAGLGGKWAMLAQIVGSTYFGIGLTAVGVGYAILGEAPIRPVVGRIGSLLLLLFGCAAALGATTTLTLGYVELKIQKLASGREVAYAIWQLAPNERDNFASIIKVLPPTTKLQISFLPTSSQAGMLASSIAEAASKDDLNIQPSADYSLPLSLVGVYVLIDTVHRKDGLVPQCAKVLIDALTTVGIKYNTSTKDSVGSDGCLIAIGIKPPDGR